MAYDELSAERVRRALAGRRGLVEKKMMGAVCFMVGGNMCCGVTGDALLVRVGADAYPTTLKEPHVRPREFAGRRPKGFVLVDPAGWRTEKALAGWVKRGLDFAGTLPKKTSPKKKPAAKKPKRNTTRR
jgi:TfoX/Sxy family transcriptional regulator of competence genes